MSMKKNIIFLLIVVGGFYVFNTYRGSKKIESTDGVIVVGTNAEYPPYTFIENKNIVGFDIDIIQEIGKRLEKKIRIQDMPFDVLIPEIQRGSIEVIAAGLSPSSEREKELHFTTSYLTGDPLAIVARKDSGLTTIEQLTGKEVIVNDGYTADLYMSKIKGPVLRRLPNPASAFLALESNRAEAYVVAYSTIDLFFKDRKRDAFVITPIPDTEEKYAFAVGARNDNLLEQLNKVIIAMKEDGTLETLKVKWSLK